MRYQKLLQRLHISQSHCIVHQQQLSVLDMWQTNPKAKAQRQHARAAQHYHSRVRKSALLGWASAVVVLHSARTKLLSCLMRAADGRFILMFEEWVYMTRRQKLLQRALHSLRRRRSLVTLSRILVAWKGWTAQHSMHSHCLRSVAQVLGNSVRVSLLLQSVKVSGRYLVVLTSGGTSFIVLRTRAAGSCCAVTTGGKS